MSRTEISGSFFTHAHTNTHQLYKTINLHILEANLIKNDKLCYFYFYFYKNKNNIIYHF